MKKLLLLFLAVAGMVSTANAQITESGYKKIYIHDNTSLGWETFKIRFWNDGEDDLLDEGIEEIDGLEWHVFKMPSAKSKNVGILAYNGTWGETTQTNDFNDGIWGDSFFTMDYSGSGHPYLTKQVRYYMIQDTATDSPTKLTKNGDAWDITIQESSGFKFSIVNNWAYQSGSFSWSEGSNIYRPNDDASHMYLDFTNKTNYNFTKDRSDGNWIVSTDNSVQHHLYFTFTNNGWDAATYSDYPSFTRTINSVGYATFSYTANVDIEGAVATYITGINENNELAEESFENNRIAANTGALLYKDGGGTVKFTPATGDPTAASGNLLVAVSTDNDALDPTEKIDNVDYTNYILTNLTENGEKTIGFYRANSTTKNKIKAGKAYLHLPTVNASRAFFALGENEVSGVEAVEKTSKAKEGYYNLNGQRIAQPNKGIYIVNGKKVIIK